MASHDSSVILQTMLRLFKCGSFNLQAKPDVVFSDEAGIDADGLTRELPYDYGIPARWQKWYFTI